MTAWPSAKVWSEVRSDGLGIGSVGEGGSVDLGGNLFPVFSLLAPNSALRATENPRVDGSISSLATTSNWSIRITWFTPHSVHLDKTVSERRLTT